MSDILESLRAAFDGQSLAKKNIALRKAADEIERLQAQNAKLRAFLKDVAEDCAADVPPSYGAIKYGIRYVLEDKG